jgi:beta-glucosidase
MATLAPLLLHGLLALSLALVAYGIPGDHGNLTRQSFPPGFVFGTASSAYQVEGNTLKYGRGPCIWDTFLKYPGEIDEPIGHHCISWDFFHLTMHIASLLV